MKYVRNVRRKVPLRKMLKMSASEGIIRLNAKKKKKTTFFVGNYFTSL